MIAVMPKTPSSRCFFMLSLLSLRWSDCLRPYNARALPFATGSKTLQKTHNYTSVGLTVTLPSDFCLSYSLLGEFTGPGWKESVLRPLPPRSRDSTPGTCSGPPAPYPSGPTAHRPDQG